MGISKNWATAHFLAFCGQPRNCHGTCGCGVSFSMLMYYNEHIMRLKVYWKLNLPPSWTYAVLTSFCCILNSCVILLKVVPCPLPSCFSSRSLSPPSTPHHPTAKITGCRSPKFGPLYLQLPHPHGLVESTDAQPLDKEDSHCLFNTTCVFSP